MRAAALSAAVLVLLGAASAQAHTYGGTTAKQARMSLRVAADSSRVVALSTERELACRKGRIRSFRTGVFRQARTFVRRSGRFLRGSIRTRGPRGSLVRRGRFAIRLIVRGESVAIGVFRERVRLRDGTRCTSGRVRFRLPLVDTND